MRLLFLTTVLVMAAAGVAHGQKLSDYLKLRAKYHIVMPISSQDLDALKGTKVVEIDGVVQGTFTTGPVTSLMVQRSDGQTEVVDTSTPPEWLCNGDVPARLLIKATRNDPNDSLAAQLLAAAPDAEMQKIDAAYWRAEAAKHPKSKRGSSLASRGGGKALYGWIGTARPRTDWVLPKSDKTPQYAAYIKKLNPRLTDAKAYEIAEAVVGFSIHFGCDARLVMAVLIVESGFDPASTSRSGAMGLGQLMPGTAAWMGVSHPYDTNENLYGSVKLLRMHLDKYKSQTGDDFNALVLALAAYNAGVGAVHRHGGVPPYRETQAYVRRVIEIYNRLCGR